MSRQEAKKRKLAEAGIEYDFDAVAYVRRPFVPDVRAILTSFPLRRKRPRSLPDGMLSRINCFRYACSYVLRVAAAGCQWYSVAFGTPGCVVNCLWEPSTSDHCSRTSSACRGSSLCQIKLCRTTGSLSSRRLTL